MYQHAFQFEVQVFFNGAFFWKNTVTFPTVSMAVVVSAI